MGRYRNEKIPGFDKVELCALEADVAFFNARVSLAGERQGTSYQVAQKKTYELLGQVMAGTLETLRDRLDC